MSAKTVNPAISYVRTGANFPDRIVQIERIEKIARKFRITIVSYQEDGDIDTPALIRGHSVSIGGALAVMDQAKGTRRILMWSRALLADLPWQDGDGRSVLQVLDLVGSEIVEVSRSDLNLPIPPPPESFHGPLAVRLVEGRRRSARRGNHVSGPVPYGYERGVDGVLVPYEPEAGIVREIFTSYAHRRGSMKTIAKALSDRNLKTSTGKPFSRASIGFILGNPVYAGRIRYEGTTVHGRHKALVPHITFNLAARKRLEQFKNTRRDVSLAR